MSEAGERRALADAFLRIAYEINMAQDGATITLEQVAECLDPETLETTGADYVSSLSNAGKYLSQRGLLIAMGGSKTSGPSMFKITREGIDEVEGRNQRQEPSVTFNMEGSTFNQSPVGMNNTNSFTGDLNFANVQQRIESEAKEEDKEELRQLVAEVKELLDNGQTANKGFLAKWNDKLREYEWLARTVGGWLVNFATQV